MFFLIIIMIFYIMNIYCLKNFKLCATVKAVIVFTTFSRPVTKNNKPKIKRM